MKEKWCHVKEYEGIYIISNFGRVISLARKYVPFDKKLKPTLSGKYLTVKLYKDGKGKTFTIHSLMAISFWDFKSNYTEVIDHKDNNPLNNNLSNLQIITQRKNVIKNTNRGISDYVGVYFNKDRNKWVASVFFDKKLVYLGGFDSESSAKLAYDTKYKSLQNNGQII